MKIGILTFHREINDGSLLQTYCLYRLLKVWFRHAEVEIIDYNPTYVKKKTRCIGKIGFFPFIKFNKKRFIKKYHQHQFLKNNLKLSPKAIKSDEHQLAIKEISDLGYDAIFVGSDTVWDTRKNGGGPPAPNIYFLPGLHNIKKISFAASMDKGYPYMVNQDTWNYLIECINDFNFISVRDEDTLKKLVSSGLSKDRISFMPDPTILYDFSNIMKYPDEFIKKSPNLAGVAVSDHHLRQQVTKQLIAKGFSVINLLSEPVEYQLSVPATWNYEERLSVHAGLKFMVTDRFHGSILTLKLGNAPVFFIEPDYYYPFASSKGRDLFIRLGIEKMVWRYKHSEKIPECLIEQAISLSKTIKWPIHNKIQKMCERAKPEILKIKHIINNL